MTERERQPYKLQFTLSGHTRPINCLKFSGDGCYLASGGDDGHVRVYALLDGKLVKDFNPQQGAIQALQWIHRPQLSPDLFLVIGGLNGTIQLWRKPRDENTVLYLSIKSVTEYQIEDVAVEESQGLVAVVAGGRLFLHTLDLNNQAPFKRVRTEPATDLDARRALARSVCFYDEGRAVMVGYLDSKEIICWSISPWKQIERHVLTTKIGRLVWSPSTRNLLIWNMVDGVDVYRMTHGNDLIPKGKLPVRLKSYFPHDMAFAQQDSLAVFGTDKGEVQIWNVEARTSLQSLRHGPASQIIQVVDSHSPQDGLYRLASASANQGDSRPLVKVWCTSSQLPLAFPRKSRQLFGYCLLAGSVVLLAVLMSVMGQMLGTAQLLRQS